MHHTASPQEVRSAYLRAARVAHPDMIGGNVEEMARLNEAWAVLSVPAERRRYDKGLRLEAAPYVPMMAADEDLDDAIAYGDEIDDHGRPLSAPLQLLTRAVPLLLLVGFVALGVGAILQVGAVLSFGIVTCLVAIILFALTPFFAMSSRR